MQWFCWLFIQPDKRLLLIAPTCLAVDQAENERNSASGGDNDGEYGSDRGDSDYEDNQRGNRENQAAHV